MAQTGTCPSGWGRKSRPDVSRGAGGMNRRFGMMGSRHRPAHPSIKTSQDSQSLRHAMATQTNRSYSEFFSSGLRAMSGMSYSSKPSSGYSSPIIPPGTPPNAALKSSGRYNVLRSLSRRPRTSSSPTSAFTPSEITTSAARKHQRRTSIVDLPSRLLGRMMNSTTDTWSLPDKAHDRVRRSEDAPYSTRNSSSYEKIRPVIDPFDASPYSSSFFIDYVETTPVSISPPPQTQRPQSFLLLGEPTKTTYLGFSLRRPRPTSIQSMPLPSQSQSRRSSLQYRPMSRDKYDRSWALEEEEAPSPAWSDDAEEMNDPAANIDWRQFHNDLLHED
ncbi:hypothetical protein MVEN_02199900 [Mycena venus]|uniref:Uncharacterized protein n=1 Tax=Mycena venus TaxID=2733690 RepID=A0A8H6X7H9_9AGAR|nr:hypothetical protein MVEN_02199900 [Mycena venus]